MVWGMFRALVRFGIDSRLPVECVLQDGGMTCSSSPYAPTLVQ